MTTQLAVYNKALGHLGERKLASLAENREPRRVLDDHWDVDTFLEMGLWRFARRTARFTYDPSIEPPFGYRRGFPVPDDFIRTAKLASDEYFKAPLEEYSIEARVWYADEDEIYVSYISNDPQYGGNIGEWPPSFEEWVACYLASKAAMRITGDEKKANYLLALEGKLLTIAKSRDAMEDPTQPLPHGRWARSRSARSGRADRGNRNSLLG